MVDPSLKHKNGVLFIIGTLVLVAAFWIYHAPHTHFYRTYRLKQKLRSLSLPPRTQLLNINDINTVEIYGLTIDGITGVYATNVDCDIVKTHYKQEFARQGFTYVNDHHASGPESAQLNFSTSEFSASLSCGTVKTPILYLITMHWNTPRN